MFEVDGSQSIPMNSSEISGSFEIDFDDKKLLEAIMNLCSQESVDKVTIVYRNYEFCLMGVSLKGTNKDPPIISLGKRNFKFRAKDIRLDSLFQQ
jgi:hypothetical protein